MAGGSPPGVHYPGSGGQGIFVNLGCVFQPPVDITSDRGPQFVSELWPAMADGLGAKVHSTNAYKPQSNGMCERSLKAAFRTSLKDGNWVDFLLCVLLGLYGLVCGVLVNRK